MGCIFSQKTGKSGLESDDQEDGNDLLGLFMYGNKLYFLLHKSVYAEKGRNFSHGFAG